MCVATNGMGKTQQTPDFIRLPKSRDCASKIHSPSQHSAASHREGTGLCRSACVASILATTPAGRLPQFCAVRAPFARRKIARTRPRNVETVSRACSCRVCPSKRVVGIWGGTPHLACFELCQRRTVHHCLLVPSVANPQPYLFFHRKRLVRIDRKPRFQRERLGLERHRDMGTGTKESAHV